MTSSPTGCTIGEAEEFLAAHPGIEAVDLILTDANGIGRGKIIRRHELPAAFAEGRNLPCSILGLDVCGDDVHETGLTWERGDEDQRAWPVPGTLKPIAGTKPPRAQVLMNCFEQDGTPAGADPRLALLRQTERFTARGLKAAGAFELEFYLFDAAPGPDGRPVPARGLNGGRQAHGTQVYTVDELNVMEPVFTDIYAMAAAQDIPLETMISEFAAGQYELTLHYRNDVLTAADDLVMLKRIVRHAARRHGLTACFMAKPFGDKTGSGMHFHVSAWDRHGNIFTEKPGGTWSPALLHAIGGLAATMPESMLVFAPHANSWRRFASASYAPVSTSWGVNNRSVALRVPASGPKARRIEHRPSGVDANPYLVAATVLAGILKGLDEKLDPGPEVTGNGYEAKPDPAMPSDWRSAIEAAKASTFLKDALGEAMHHAFCTIKQAEYLRVASTVPDIDYGLYLHAV
ncbi:MAG: glutamine synthetase [Notoacmeibacter sp.]|nr:glutamine synthetase [Notoacmeibacter sp.]